MKDAPLPVSQHLLSCHTRGNSSDVKKTKPKKLTLFCSLTKKILVIKWKDYFWIRSVFTLCFTFCLFSHLDVKTESKFIDDVFLQRNIKWNMSGLLNGTFYVQSKTWFWYQLTARTSVNYDKNKSAVTGDWKIFKPLFKLIFMLLSHSTDLPPEQVKHNFTFIVNVFCVYKKRQSKIKLHSFLFSYLPNYKE